MRVEIVGAQGVLPQALCVVIVGWPEAGVCGSLGQMTGCQQPEMKTRLFAADGLSKPI